MSTRHSADRKLVILLALALCATVGGGLLFAGPLNPPAGPVASTYKTLTEVEPRTAINATNTPGDADSLFKITQPGSYYLTGNITGVVGKHGIEIATSGVTLDLNGFDILGVPAMGAFDGVSATLANVKNITIFNGTIRDWGGDGIDLNTVLTNLCRVESVTASNNAGNGISARANATMGNCLASQNGANGILLADGCTAINCSALANVGNGLTAANTCVVTHCFAFQNAGTGISTGVRCTITDCTSSLGTLDGFTVAFECKFTNCTASGNLLNGISTGDACAITNCTASANSGTGIGTSNDCSITGCSSLVNGIDGIRVISRCRVTENTCNRNGTAGFFSGILANGANNRIEDNHVSLNDAGISTPAAATGNIIIRNTATGNSVSYNVQNANNIVGTVVTTTAALNAATNSNVNISQ